MSAEGALQAALKTLRASAVLEGLPEARLVALAARLGPPVKVKGARKSMELGALPEGSFALLTHESRLLFFVERRRVAPIKSPGRRHGPGAPEARAPADDWTLGAEREEGGSTMSTVPTLFGGTAIFPVVGRHLRLKTETDCGYYLVTSEILEAVAADPAWGRATLEATLERLRRDSVLATSPATRRSGARQRAVVGDAMSFRAVHNGEPLVDLDAPADALYVVAGAGSVALTRRTPGGEVTYALGYGGVFGGEALSTDATAPASPIRAVAEADTELLVLPRAAIRSLLFSQAGSAREGGADWFRLFAASFREVDRNASTLVSNLRMLPVLGGLGDDDLYALLQGAELLRWRLNWPDPEPVNQVPGFGLVLEGELLRVGNRPGHRGGATSDLHTLHPESAVRPGESFGLLDMVLGEPVGRVWQARTPAKVVFFLRHRCFEVLDKVETFLGKVIAARGANREILAARARLTTPTAPNTPPPAPVLLFQPVGTGNVFPHLPALLEALADTLHADFGERAAVVDLGGEPTPAALEAAVLRARQQPGLHWVLVLARNEPTLWPLADRVVLTHADRRIPFSEPSPRRVASVFTTILPTDVPVEDAGSPPSRNVYPPNRVRLTMPLAGGARPAATWRAEYPEDFSRWARAVTDRRVGVALGGGGAWGYAHLAVLYHLKKQGVPVDMVSGASFGSVVGAFYAAEQNDGLLKLMRNGGKLNVATQAAFLTYVPLQMLIDRLLGGRRLEDLVIPFFPATTDVVSGSEDYVSRGTLGQGVRASGGLSPMMPPTRTAFATWVDGGMVANVPAGVLRQEGARFVVSSNVVPPPETRPDAPMLPRWYGQVLADLNPFARMEAAVASWMTAMATIGEYSASSADVQFDAAQPRALPIDMDGGLKIVENAVSNPAFWDALKSARDHWVFLSGSPR
jgi:predicted acylesterase/phospholipase RssA/CRP-like cAMP-binding protein